MSDLNFLDTSGNKQTITVPALNSMAFNTANTERLRISGIGSFGFGTSDPHRKVDVIGNSLVVRPTTSLEGSSGNANAVNNSIIARMPYGQNPGSSNNAGARVGIQFTGATDPNSSNWGYVNDPQKSASIYGVSEDTSAGYSRRMALAFYTSGFDVAQSEKMRISSSGAVTKPNHPSFRINRTVGNNYTSTTLNEILPFDVVEWDKTNVTGYGYDTSTYKYRVAVAGVYWFHCAVYTDSNAEVMFDIVKNSAGNYIQRAELRQSGGDDIGNNSIVHCAGLSQCAVGDYIFVVNSGASNIELIGGNAEGYIDFSGYLIG